MQREMRRCGWQTETIGICISPTPSAPGSEILLGMQIRPMYGIWPAILEEKGNELKDNNDVTSVLCLKNPWPRMARTIYGTYYSRFMETNNQPFSKRPQGWRQFPCGSSCFGGGQLRSGATPIRISSVPAPGILSKTVFLIAEPPVQAAKRINNVKNRLKRRIFLTTKKCAAFATTTQRLLSSIEWPQLSKLWNATATKGRRENKRRIRFEKSWQEGTSWPFLKTLDIIHYFLF
ncbi:uncharacterized protein LOC124316496 isoform X2 [Daphnia pulicaria]|uniref:uncharacterized protein LOC124316496 isoform X2 n=1 Tax=Daphnia pulicaria TaxID=35523 RepID=UPI001EEBDE1B|nr:uncharacterized protein LOC124316496 isoform X2 [Daphnia pulicaria]